MFFIELCGFKQLIKIYLPGITMKYLLFIFTSFNCLLADAQHWPTYMFQHDSIYKNAKVKSIQWKADSTKSSLLFEVEIDQNGHITKLAPQLDPTVYYKYDDKGKLIEEEDWDGAAVFTYDEFNRVLTKIYYSDEQVMVKKVTITYNPTTMVSIRYEDGKQVERKKYSFETPTTVKEYCIENSRTYGEIKYKYFNSYNQKGQIIKTTNMTIVGEASYQYDSNGLLTTITITHSLEQQAGDPPIVQKLIYTYY